MFCKKTETKEWFFSEEEKQAIWNFIHEKEYFRIIEKRAIDLYYDYSKISKEQSDKINELQIKIDILINIFGNK